MNMVYVSIYLGHAFSQQFIVIFSVQVLHIFVRLIPTYYMFLSYCFNFISYCSLLLYKIHLIFIYCLYSTTWLHSLVNFSNFFLKSMLDCLLIHRSSSVIKGSFTSFFPIWMFIFLSLLHSVRALINC